MWDSWEVVSGMVSKRENWQLQLTLRWLQEPYGEAKVGAQKGRNEYQ